MFFFGGFKYRPDERDHENQLFSDICFVLFAFFNCVWSTAYLESWKRKQVLSPSSVSAKVCLGRIGFQMGNL